MQKKYEELKDLMKLKCKKEQSLMDEWGHFYKIEIGFIKAYLYEFDLTEGQEKIFFTFENNEEFVKITKTLNVKDSKDDLVIEGEQELIQEAIDYLKLFDDIKT